MTNRGADFNGEHRQSDPQASGGAADPSSGPDLGAGADYRTLAKDFTRAYGGAKPCYPSTMMVTGIYGAPMFVPAAPEPLKIEEAGISAGEIIGYRAWRVLSNDELTSMYTETYTWRPGQIHKINHSLDVTEGFYAFKEHAQLMAEFGVPLGMVSEWSPIVYGTVALWGEVIEHDFGYRAQYAAIKSFDKIHGVFFKSGKLRKLRRNFGV